MKKIVFCIAGVMAAVMFSEPAFAAWGYTDYFYISTLGDAWPFTTYGSSGVDGFQVLPPAGVTIYNPANCASTDRWVLKNGLCAGIRRPTRKGQLSQRRALG
jgi:hypothetical protein